MIILMCYFLSFFIIQFCETLLTELYFYIFCFLDFYFHLIIVVVLFQKSCTVLDQTHVYMSLYIYTYRSLVRPNSETKKTSFVELLLHDFLLINARTPSLFRLTKKQHKV